MILQVSTMIFIKNAQSQMFEKPNNL